MSDGPTITFVGEGAAGGPWVVCEVSSRESLNQPYLFSARLTSDGAAASPLELLGRSATVTFTTEESERRTVGIVTAISEDSVPTTGNQVQIEVTIEPALATLRHRVNTRIFQEQTVPEILQAVLEEGLGGHGRVVDSRLNRTYPCCEYRVQYDESDLTFCHRLMEEEGIAYFFEHDGDAEVLVLGDDPSAHSIIELPAGGAIPFSARTGGTFFERVRTLHSISSIRPTKLRVRHFDWTHPSVSIEEESSDEAEDDVPGGAYVDPEREIYEHDSRAPTLHEFSGTYGASDVDDQVRLRRESQAHDARVIEGCSSVISMAPGGVMDVSGAPVFELDRKYLVIEVSQTVRPGASYENQFRCIPDDVPFRPARTTPRPQVRSVETATVVGPSGEEIHTDEHGRIKVQFHWDRLGEMDEHASCWMRVMQPWAGDGWGFVFLPRMGMEVVVRFVDGDPDRPLVIGTVYNADHPPPYALPGDKTKSTIKTESSLGGGGYNELRFEDLSGSEEVFIHAQKDFNEVVENDHTTTVHHDQKIRVDNDQRQEVGNNQTEHVFANQDLTVDANRTITVHGDFTETVDGGETKTVTSGSTETITGGETRNVTGGMTETITGDRTQAITGNSTESITGSLTQTIVAGASITTPATYDISALGGVTITAPAGVTIIATAGHEVIAPGGQTIIDGTFGKSGAMWFDSIGTQFTATMLFLRYKTAWLVVQGAAFELTTMKLSKTGLNLGGYGGYLRSRRIHRKAVAIANHVAGAHVITPGG